jgi:hypothetical protein
MGGIVTDVQPRHHTLDLLSDTGFALLRRYPKRLDPAQWERLTYLDWKSGGDTNFAVLASATGEDDPRGFWEHGKPDKDGIWTGNAAKAPALRDWTTSVGARYGRVRVIKLQPSVDYASVVNSCLHQDDNNRLNPDGEARVVRAWLNLTDDPDSFMVLREERDDPTTEHHIPLPAGAQFIVDTERLWHAVLHTGNAPRYALIASFECGPALDAWAYANSATHVAT